VLTVSGWLGGQLAYRYGVRVAEESTQAEAYQSATTLTRPGVLARSVRA
jgi:hypothetical protein